jgi:hypothetical protein
MKDLKIHEIVELDILNSAYPNCTSDPCEPYSEGFSAGSLWALHLPNVAYYSINYKAAGG